MQPASATTTAGAVDRIRADGALISESPSTTVFVRPAPRGSYPRLDPPAIEPGGGLPRLHDSAAELRCVFRSTWAAIPTASGQPFRSTWARSERSDGIPLPPASVPPLGARGRSDDQPFCSVFFPLSPFTFLLDALPREHQVSSAFLPPSPFVFLIDGPLSDSTCALWTSRSQIASATVGSASISCQVFVGTWLVTTVERWSYRSSSTSSRSRRSVSFSGAMSRSSSTSTSSLARRPSIAM